MTVYEVFAIAHPRLSQEEVNSVVTLLEKSIEKGAGAAIAARKIEYDQPLAYLLKKQLKGHVIHMEVEITGDNSILTEVGREMRVRDDILRFMVVKKAAAGTPIRIENTTLGEMRSRKNSTYPQKKDPASS